MIWSRNAFASTIFCVVPQLAHFTNSEPPSGGFNGAPQYLHRRLIASSTLAGSFIATRPQSQLRELT
jgi:hypothetical protein